MTVPPAPGGCVGLHGSGRASPALDTGLGSALRPAAGFWASHWTLCSGVSRKRGVAGGLRSSPSGVIWLSQPKQAVPRHSCLELMFQQFLHLTSP